MQGLRLGTRGSPLALAQARKVAAAIETAQRWPDGWVQIVEIKTTGDKVQDRPLAEIGGKALWTKELDRALLAGEVDFCVHSMKDVESVRPEDIHIAAVRPRGDVRDRLIGAESINKLKQGAVVGTSSRRRQAQLLRLRRKTEPRIDFSVGEKLHGSDGGTRDPVDILHRVEPDMSSQGGNEHMRGGA